MSEPGPRSASDRRAGPRTSPTTPASIGVRWSGDPERTFTVETRDDRRALAPRRRHRQARRWRRPRHGRRHPGRASPRRRLVSEPITVLHRDRVRIRVEQGIRGHGRPDLGQLHHGTAGQRRPHEPRDAGDGGVGVRARCAGVPAPQRGRGRPGRRDRRVRCAGRTRCRAPVRGPRGRTGPAPDRLPRRVGRRRVAAPRGVPRRTRLRGPPDRGRPPHRRRERLLPRGVARRSCGGCTSGSSRVAAIATWRTTS